MSVQPSHRSTRRRHARPSATSRALALSATALVAAHAPAAAQMLDDGLMIPARQVRVSVDYSNDRWDRYWEGTLLRDNENIGTLSTRAVTWSAAYGVTRNVSVFASLPYVWTRASAGVLHEMEGRQDFSLAAKVRLLEGRVGSRARFATTALAGVGVPTDNYTPDFLPLSIGLGAKRATARAAVHLQDRSGLFTGATIAHTWRSTVHLDRPAYYTDGELVLSNEVAMPDVRDYALSVGYQRGPICLPISLAVQRTLGGGDIRRQDMPFVSNRMDATRLQAHLAYTLPRVSGLTLNLGAARTLEGRNVGRSTTLSAGLTSAFRL